MKRQRDSSADDDSVHSQKKIHSATDVVLHSSTYPNAITEFLQSSSKDERTSNLESPCFILTGHAAAVYSCDFSHSGKYLATSSRDKSVFLWNVYGENDNYGVINCHKNAVLQVRWSSDDAYLFTASSDTKVMVIDSSSGDQIRSYRHSKIVNSISSCLVSHMSNHEDILVSGSDDGIVRIFDSRSKNSIQNFSTSFPVLGVCMNEEGIVYSSGIDPSIQGWDVRTGKPSQTCIKNAHSNTITGIDLCLETNTLVSQSVDNLVRAWDMNPFLSSSVETGRLIGSFSGAKNNAMEQALLRPSISKRGNLVTAGSTLGYGCLYALGDVQEKAEPDLIVPGHKAAVFQVKFSPTDNVIASVSSDKKAILSELPSQFQ
jgi:Prp8 binding protein